MAKSHNMQCKTCVFYLDYEKNGQGECRYHAPKPTGETHSFAEWPMVFENRWCGQYEKAFAPPKGQENSYCFEGEN